MNIPIVNANLAELIPIFIYDILSLVGIVFLVPF
jgi:hypothetical protein